METREYINVVNNKEKLRFEVHLNGEYAFLEYKYYKKDIAFMHTTVPDALRSKGMLQPWQLQPLISLKIGIVK